ncbi:MAG TPA: SRPBCC family protein [Anaerolineales bacterium]|nr:SRPBCC family protein [Anaerolineales bacterium]
MAKVETSIVINRPIEEVFAFLSNRENNPKWISEVTEVSKTSDAPVGVGTTWREIRKFLSQRLENEYEYIEYEPNRKITTRSKSGPFPLEFQSRFENVEGGTRIQSIIQGEPGGFFKLAEPLLISMVKRQLETALANLKDLMEANVFRRDQLVK